MSDNREVESKFTADPATIDALLTLERADDFTIRHAGTKRQDDLYYDTSERHLRTSGSSLRIRRKLPSAQMTFKGDRVVAGGAVSRLEDEVDLAPDVVTGIDWDTPLDIQGDVAPLARARQITGDSSLLPTARIQTTRTILEVMSEAGVEVELAVDRCVAHRLFDGRQVEFEEVEAELKQGTIEDLHRVTQALARQLPGLKPATITKLQRALD